MHYNSVAIGLAGFAAIATSFNAMSQNFTVTIGLAAPLTGRMAHWGREILQGAQLAVDDLNKMQFSIDGKTTKFMLHVVDDAADPKQAAIAAQKLVDARVSGVIGHVTSSTTIPASRVYADAGIPQISPSTTSSEYTRQRYKTAFRVVANDIQLGNELAKYAVEIVKAKRIAVIDDRSAYGQGLTNEFVKSVRQLTGPSSIVSRMYTNENAVDFDAILRVLSRRRPDLVFFGGMDVVGGPLLREMKQRGIDAKLMGGDGLCIEDLERLAGLALSDNAVICADAGLADGRQYEQLDAFKERIRRTHNSRVQAYAPHAYDATMVMAYAMVKANSASPHVYLPALGKTDYQGITGKISFDDNGDIRHTAIRFYTYRAGKRIVIAERR